MGVLGAALSSNPLGLGTGIVSMFVGIVILTVLFALGVWIGDLLEVGTQKRRGTT